VTFVGRTPAEVFEYRGERVCPESRVVLSVWSANHDATAFADPERVDVAHNAQASHLAFGHGAHYCLGASLARAELHEALAALTARITCPVVDTGACEWNPPMGITGPTRLPITFSQRPRR
jgi:cytochrome P450